MPVSKPSDPKCLTMTLERYVQRQIDHINVSDFYIMPVVVEANTKPLGQIPHQPHSNRHPSFILWPRENLYCNGIEKVEAVQAPRNPDFDRVETNAGYT